MGLLTKKLVPDDKLKAWRIAEGLNQLEAAAMFGMTQANWSQIEVGKQKRTDKLTQQIRDYMKQKKERANMATDNDALYEGWADWFRNRAPASTVRMMKKRFNFPDATPEALTEIDLGRPYTPTELRRFGERNDPPNRPHSAEEDAVLANHAEKCAALGRAVAAWRDKYTELLAAKRKTGPTNAAGGSPPTAKQIAEVERLKAELAELTEAQEEASRLEVAARPAMVKKRGNARPSAKFPPAGVLRERR